MALLFTRAVSIPAPSSEISISTWPPSWQARNFRCPSGRLPRATRCVRHFDSVIHRITDDMRERILDRFEKAPVEFRFLSRPFRSALACREPWRRREPRAETCQRRC